MRYFLFVVLLSLLAKVTLADPALSLDGYLGQVKKSNQSVQGALESVQAAKERRDAGSLALSPTFFANINLMADAKLPQLPFFSYDQLNMHTYQLGVSKLTSFGLMAKLSYELDYTSFLNAQLGGAAATFPVKFYDAAPKLELAESLWGNGLGRSTRAAIELSQAQAEATQFGSRFQARSLFAQAEGAYWRLAVAREAVSIAERTLEQARKLHEWTSRRSRMNLSDNADALQSKANFELRSLDLRSAQDEERSASRALNALRNVKADKVDESLVPLESGALQSLAAPKRAELRDDVEAAKRQSKATEAATVIAEEKDKPTLDLYGSYSMNGRDTAIGSALGDSYGTIRPTKVIGMRLSVPLDFGLSASARHGAARERDAADMMFHQKVLDQEQSWDDLSRKLDEAKQRLTLSETIELAQQTKLENERKRLTNGRTTTYQVLLFEGDYAVAELQRLHAQAEILGLITQMKLYSGEEI